LKQTMRPGRFSLHILLIFLLAAWVMGVAAHPARATAQEPTPAAPSSHGSGKNVDSTIANSGAKNTAAEDENVYRHTPLVRSLAKVLHLDVETTARLFEFLNFAIVALAIVIPLARLMPKVLRKRSETLKHDLESARKLTADANARLSAIEAKLSGLDREIASMRAQVEEEAKHDEARIKSTIEEESGRIVAAAEQEIVMAATQAKRGLRHFAADLAIDQAAKQLVLTAETDRALIAEFVGDASRNGAGEGRN
jgi:F-type H+-transporting ATPase subunit b